MDVLAVQAWVTSFKVFHFFENNIEFICGNAIFLLLINTKFDRKIPSILDVQNAQILVDSIPLKAMN